jgi:LAS superfamily LD-carboxypeptidase LdcB
MTDQLLALGLSEHGLVAHDERTILDSEVSRQFGLLQRDARAEGFDLVAASSYRPYASQLTIFNAKWRGDLPVLDDADRPLSRESYSDEQWLHRILRFSALPGASRHHWGTDLDVFDPTLLPKGQTLALTPSEYSDNGYFSALTQWLDHAIANGQSRGFERPYNADRGGVAIEPWHLSYLPRASQLRVHQSPEALIDLWDQSPHLRPEGFELLSQCLGEIFARYVP